MPDYLDTSAFVKLVVTERETQALQAELAGDEPLVSSALLVVEGRRAAARYGPRALARARVALFAMTLLPVDAAALEEAASLGPPELRSLDAIHLAAALSLGDGLDRLFCYDARLSAAAAAHGLSVSAPA